MDQPGLDGPAHERALRGLRTVNLVSRSAAILWPAVSQLAKSLGRPVRLLDVAAGGGDVAISLARRARRAGLGVYVSGCDISCFAVRYARRQAVDCGLDDTDFFELDVITEPLSGEFDIVTCSLFLHHLANGEAAELLKKMSAAARHLLLVNDLRRTRLGYAIAWLGSRLVTRSPIVHIDGPRSVEAAFTMGEANELAKQAGLADTVISRHWPQRYLLTWRST